MKNKRPLDKYVSITSPQTSDDELEITSCTQHKLKLLNISIEKRKKNRNHLIDTLIDYITANASTKKKYQLELKIKEMSDELEILFIKKQEILLCILNT
tara:strand:- start:10870 stop:11166 length:297 start_codon:yes stop_codon:yes gene_type:complete